MAPVDKTRQKDKTLRCKALAASEIGEIWVDAPNRASVRGLHVGDGGSEGSRGGDGVRCGEDLPDDLAGGRKLARRIQGQREPSEAACCNWAGSNGAIWREFRDAMPGDK